MMATPPLAPHVALARRLNLPLAVLFGLGVTIGAGIYVLIGATAGRAGMHAPIAFLLAALVMAPTAAVFAEFATRLPVSAGEAAYVEVGFGSKVLAIVVGAMVIAVGVISAAAIGHGSAGYIRTFIDLPTNLIILTVVVAMGAVAAWGILQSVAIAGLMTLIEIGGLLTIIIAGVLHSPDLVTRLPEMWTGLTSLPVLTGTISATLLAFFAFIGFETLANVAEEVRVPQRTLPRAIFITLVTSTVFYVLVTWIALVAVPSHELAAAPAPLSLVFERVTGASPAAISMIAIVATINGIIAQIVMASRVVYGLADRKLLQSSLAHIDPQTQTPLPATAVVVAAILVLAIVFPVESLAETSARLTLMISAVVNAALVQLKRTGGNLPAAHFTVPIAIPIIGCLLCVALLLGSLFG